MIDDELRPRARPIPDRCADGPGTIVVGIDGSDSSLHAAAYAAGLARRQGSRLVVVYVRKLASPALPLAGAVVAVIDAQDQIERELRTAVEQRVSLLALDVELVVRTGEPYAELIEVAEQVHADAVIVGRSTKLLHRVMGSLAVKLVRAGRWPVTVVP
ncbi:universal stress protein [Actinoplanes sp. NPDC051513]|uniref:universal stress protein n=1 Tax=Actinoplanes sp. NPDC051513 TaxID=3363908 RepID=UPI00378AA031